MKDYSKYFQNIESSDIDSSYGFITKLEIVGEEIHVWTPQTKKGEPHKYPLDKLSHFLNRLETQYQTIIDNQDVIKKDYMKRKNKINLITKVAIAIELIAICGTIVCGATAIIESSAMITFLTPVIALGGLLIGVNTYIQTEKKFEEELETYKTFIEKNREIESLSKTDPNVTANLTKKTNNDIKSREVLKENGTIDQVFNIDFMDKTSLKELRKLIESYNGCKSLFIPQEFINPSEVEEETNGRSKTLAPKK